MVDAHSSPAFAEQGRIAVDRHQPVLPAEEPPDFRALQLRGHLPVARVVVPGHGPRLLVEAVDSPFADRRMGGVSCDVSREHREVRMRVMAPLHADILATGIRKRLALRLATR